MCTKGLYLYCLIFYRIARDIELMTGQKPSIYWLICWKYISPVAILGIFFSSMVTMFMESPQYEKYEYDATITNPNDLKSKEDWPAWAIVIAAMLILLSILWIPIMGCLR